MIQEDHLHQFPGPSVIPGMGYPDDRFVQLAFKLERPLRALLRRYTGNRADIDDLLQEANMRLLIAGSDEQFRNVGSERGFVVTTVRHVAIDWLRARGARPGDAAAMSLDELEIALDGSALDEMVNTEQELNILAEAVERLPALTRRVFTLRKLYGLTQKETAAFLNISDAAVHYHHSQASRRGADNLFARKIASDSVIHRIIRKMSMSRKKGGGT